MISLLQNRDYCGWRFHVNLSEGILAESYRIPSISCDLSPIRSIPVWAAVMEIPICPAAGFLTLRRESSRMID